MGPEIKLLVAEQDRNLFLSLLPVIENRASFWNSVFFFLNKISEMVDKRGYFLTQSLAKVFRFG